MQRRAVSRGVLLFLQPLTPEKENVISRSTGTTCAECLEAPEGPDGQSRPWAVPGGGASGLCWEFDFSVSKQSSGKNARRPPPSQSRRGLSVAAARE